jgi:hypothetical protein
MRQDGRRSEDISLRRQVSRYCVLKELIGGIDVDVRIRNVNAIGVGIRQPAIVYQN